MRNSTTTLSIEADCLHESARFWRKDPTKKALIAFLGATSLFRPGKGTLIRSVYYFFRGLDDLLDGEYKDVTITADPRGYAEDIKHQIVEKGSVQPKDRITRLGNYAVPRLINLACKQDDVSESVVTLIDEMVFDHDRRQTRAVSNADRLKQNYTGGLGESLNLLFVALGSPIRNRDIGSYSYAQGRLYAARDLKKDWNLGIVNVPHEILVEQAGMSSGASYAEIIAEPLITEWIKSEVGQGVEDMEKSLLFASDFFHDQNRWSIPDPGLIVLKGLGNGVLRSSRNAIASIG
jgi:hypothetical protein